MKRLELILLAGLLGAILYANVSSVSRTVDKLQAQVLRLHILANSDSEEDQALKLAVRDRLLSCSEELFGDAQTLEEAYDAAQSKLERIREIARQVVQEQGFTYDVEAELVEMPFDERVYEDLTMPAGEYEALRITIGEAEGHNWWCVMYPPLCIPAAESVRSDADQAEAYFDQGEYDLLTNPRRYRARLKCAEVFSRLWDRIRESADEFEKST